ncbi:hypothetical protein D9M71_170640 [compost metagenome]
MGPGHVRRQVHAGDHVRVIQLAAQAVAPGVGGVEAVAVAFLLRVARAGHASRCAWHLAGSAGTGLGAGGAGTCAGFQRACAEYRAAAEAQVAAIGIAQAIDAVVTHLTHQGQAAGAHDLVEETGGGQLGLQHRHALVALQLRTGGIVRVAGDEQRRVLVTNRGQVEVGTVELQRHVRPVADLTPH